MKKFLSILTVLCCVLALTACAGRRSSVTEPDGSLDPCTLRFSWWGGDDRHEATLAAIDLWSSIHPEIKIVPEYGGWDGWTEKVAAQISGGTAPDVMQINYDWLISFAGEDTFYDLDRLSDRLDISGFSDEVLSFGKSGDSLLAVPVSLSGRGLFYNSQVYSRLGEEFPSTWSELTALGEPFSKAGIYPLDLDIQSGGTAWYLAVVKVQQDTGREFISMDGQLGFTVEDITSALRFYKELEDAHVTRTVKTRTDEDGSAALYQSPEFIGGSVAGVLEWGSSVGKYEMVLPEGVLQAGPFLTGDDGSSGGWMIKPSLLYSVSGKTDHPDEAAAFISFLLNDEACADVLGTTRGIPASRYAEESLEKNGKLTGLAQECDEMLEELDTVTISPYMELTRMKEYYNTAVEAVSYGTAGPDEAAQEMYDSITAYLEKMRK
ncbi:MAG: carbohydrate ABC transporter substrate-binding protein [Ruminococcus sp.]|nr:carbohydrate ABC transporter substrate-binding protein [Ruminococcus sp.]